MPRLPDLNALGERPIPRPGTAIYGYQTRADEGIEGQAVARFGAIVTSIAEKEQEHIDKIAAEDAFNQIRNTAIDLSVGEQGFASVKGADTVRRPMFKEFTGKLDDASKKIEAQLQNDTQRTLYRQRYGVAQTQFNEHLLRHQVNERDAYADQVYEGVNATELRNIGAQFLDPNATNLSILRMMKAAEDMGTRKRMAKEALDAVKQGVLDRALTVRFESWMYSDPVGAYKAFKENADKISPHLRLQLETKLKQAAIPLEVKNAAATIMGAAGEAEVTRVAANNPQAVQTAVSMMVDTETQLTRDRERLAILQNEAKANPNDPNLKKEISTLEANLASGRPFAGKVGKVATGATSASVSAPQTVADTRAMLSRWLDAAEADAQRTHPNDLIYRDALITEIKSKVNTIAAAQQGIAHQAHSALIAAAIPIPGRPAPTNLQELVATPDLARAWQLTTPESQRGILSLLEHNSRNSERVNPRVTNELFHRIHLPDDHPEKIRDLTQLTPFIGDTGREGYNFLKKELDERGSAGGKSFTDDLQRVRQAGHNMITRSILGSVQPDVAEEAAYRFAMDLNRKVEDYKKAYAAGDKSKDPRLLLTPGTKDYALDPARVMSFMTPAASAVAAEADKVKAGQAAGLIPPTASMTKLDPKNPQETYDSLAPGAWFVAPDGRVGRKRSVAPAEGGAELVSEPPGTVKAITIPELVDVAGGRRGAREDPERARAQFTAAGTDYAGAMTTLVTLPLRLQAAGIGATVRALTPDEGLRATKSFRQMIKSKRYTVASELIIVDALASGLLTDEEQVAAKTMLEQIETKKGR